MSDSAPVPTRITSFLLDAGVVTPEQVEAALARQRETGLRIGETLVEMGAATEEDIAWALARQLGISFVDLHSDMLDRELVGEFSAGLLERLEVVPLIRGEDSLSVAMSDPADEEAIAEIAALAGCRVEAGVATPTAIRHVLGEMFGIRSRPRAIADPYQVTPGASGVVWDRSGATFLLFHLDAAHRCGANAIHFVADEQSLRVSYRVDGRTIPVVTEPAELIRLLVVRLEALGLPAPRAGETVHRAAHLAIPGSDLVVDASVVVHDRGLAISFRLPAPGPRPGTLSELGLAVADLARVRAAIARPSGLVLVTGPPGSGVSTTLGCLLHEAATSGGHAVAFVMDGRRLEVPPGSIVVPLASPGGIGVGEDIVRAQDPDIVVLDDLCPGEDIVHAARPAWTGRRVLAGTDWDDPFAMLEHLGRRPYARSAAWARLELVIAQRRLGADAASDGPPPAARPGRPTFEVLAGGAALRAALRRGAPAEALREIAAGEVAPTRS